MADMTADTPKKDMQSSTKKTGVNVSPVFLGYLALIIFGVVVLVALQHQYWYGEFGRYEFAKLNAEVASWQRLNASQQVKNNALKAEVKDLKSGLGAIEEHARLELGLIKSGETFVELSTAPVINTREMAEGVDSSSATEPVEGLLDGVGGYALTDVGSDTGEN